MVLSAAVRVRHPREVHRRRSQPQVQGLFRPSPSRRARSRGGCTGALRSRTAGENARREGGHRGERGAAGGLHGRHAHGRGPAAAQRRVRAARHAAQPLHARPPCRRRRRQPREPADPRHRRSTASSRGSSSLYPRRHRRHARTPAGRRRARRSGSSPTPASASSGYFGDLRQGRGRPQQPRAAADAAVDERSAHVARQGVGNGAMKCVSLTMEEVKRGRRRGRRRGSCSKTASGTSALHGRPLGKVVRDRPPDDRPALRRHPHRAGGEPVEAEGSDGADEVSR